MGGKDDCTCSRGLALTWLVVFNLIFALVGLGFLTIGILLRFKSDLFETYVLDILTTAQVDGVDLKSIFTAVSIVTAVLGLIIAGIAVMGCIGGCCKVKTLLTIYAVIMIKLLILEIVAIIVFVACRSMIDDRIKGALQPTLDTYEGYNSTQVVTIGWNFVFSKFECCGIDDYNDLSTASNWPTSITYAGSAATLVAPIFCCVHEGIYPTMTLPADANCAENPNATLSNYERGCYDAVEDYLLDYRIAMIVTVSVVMACQLFSFIATTILKKKTSQVEDAPPPPAKVI